MNNISGGTGLPGGRYPDDDDISQKRQRSEESDSLETTSPTRPKRGKTSKVKEVEEQTSNVVQRSLTEDASLLVKSPKRSREEPVSADLPEEKPGTVKQAKSKEVKHKSAQVAKGALGVGASSTPDVKASVPKAEEKLSYWPQDFIRLLRSGHVFPPNVTVKGNLTIHNDELLTSLPKGLLIEGYLDLIHCPNLTSLPEGLKVKGFVHIIDCSNLTSLPQGLQAGGLNLSIFYCPRLTTLPEGLRVRKLELNGCTGLTSLPEDLQISGNLDIDRCWSLTSLPSWITTLGPQSDGDTRHIVLNATGLSETIINRLHETPARGIQFHLSQAASVPEKIFSDLDEALLFWAQKADSPDKPNVTFDLHLDKVLEFLGRLTTTAEYKNLQSRPLLAERVLEAFDLMAEDEAIKERAVDLIYHGLASCDDRIISALDQIELMVRIYEIERSSHTKEDLKKLGRSFLLLDMINQKVAEFIKTLPYVDEIEIYLAFQIGLARRFDLPVKTSNMIFRRMAQVTDEQIAQVGNEVEKACTAEKLDAYLQTWSPWMDYQRKAVPLWENLPLAATRKLAASDTCLITREAPEHAVLYNNNIYDYYAFVQWYRTTGKDPISSEPIDLQKLVRLEK